MCNYGTDIKSFIVKILVRNYVFWNIFFFNSSLGVIRMQNSIGGGEVLNVQEVLTHFI